MSYLDIVLAGFDKSSMIPRMSFPARLRQATLLSLTLLVSASPGARTRYIESLDPQQARDFDRVHELLVPLAQAVLQSQDREDLDVNIESQVFSGLFADIIARSGASITRPLPGDSNELPDELRVSFLDSVERIGGDRSEVTHALELSMLSNKLARAIAASHDDFADDDGQLFQLDPSDFLYDIEVPLQVREAAYADFESSICMIAVAYAAEHNTNIPKWLLEDLVHRWISGRLKSLAATWGLAIERGVVTDDNLTVELDKLERHDGVAPLDLFAVRVRTAAILTQLEAIAKHANRQPDGVWPRKA